MQLWKPRLVVTSQTRHHSRTIYHIVNKTYRDTSLHTQDVFLTNGLGIHGIDITIISIVICINRESLVQIIFYKWNDNVVTPVIDICPISFAYIMPDITCWWIFDEMNLYIITLREIWSPLYLMFSQHNVLLGHQQVHWWLHNYIYSP